MPAVALAVAAPSAVASTADQGTMGWFDSTFDGGDAPFYKPGVQPLVLAQPDGATTPVGSASVQLTFAPPGLTFEIFGLQYGDGWSYSYTVGDTVSLLWAGVPVAPGASLPPVALDMHFTGDQPTGFVATAQSPTAAPAAPLDVPVVSP